jgi:hypothetical protein
MTGGRIELPHSIEQWLMGVASQNQGMKVLKRNGRGSRVQLAVFRSLVRGWLLRLDSEPRTPSRLRFGEF